MNGKLNLQTEILKFPISNFSVEILVTVGARVITWKFILEQLFVEILQAQKIKNGLDTTVIVQLTLILSN
jgi:hypothetical protein